MHLPAEVAPVLLYLRGAQGGCCRNFDNAAASSQGQSVPALWRHFFRGETVDATETSNAIQGRTGESETKQTKQEVSGACDGTQLTVITTRKESKGHRPARTPDGRFAKSGPRLTAEEVSNLTEFIETEPSSDPAEMTARQKKVERDRKRVERDRTLLCTMGEVLDTFEPEFTSREGEQERKVAPRDYLMVRLLKIRDKRGRLQPFLMNAAQREYWNTAAKRNIVLKARQLGITTYVAARFFLNCITRPGTLCVQVAHDQRSAEEIFRIVHRLLANLPGWMRKGVLTTSHANVRQIVFPHMDSSYRVETAADENAGRGLTIHNLHCSEVARWPRDAAATLASLRAAVPPDGEIVLESTANGAGGCFYEEWQRAEQTGYSRHFFPWWWEPSYQREVEVVEFTEPELELIAKYGLTAEQIAFRRERRANFGPRFAEEYAEDAESCFLASRDCVFDVETVEQQLRKPTAIVVVENDKPSVTARQHDAFYLEWGETRAVRPSISTLMAMTCTVSYASAGTEQNGGLDRGRMLGELESELLGVCSPAVTRKNDYASGNPMDLGSNFFWSPPAFRVAKAEPGCVAREASITIYFYPEVNQA